MNIRFHLRLEPIQRFYKLFTMSLIKLLPLLIVLVLAFEQAYAQDFTHLKLNQDLSHEHPLYQRIMDEFSHQYEAIGERQAQNALQGKNVFVGGGLNKIGIRYAKDFVDFRVDVERQLEPDLFDDSRWIVRDRFSFEISASKLLSKLSEEGTIEIGESQYALFAGLSFKRQYTWIHFADSYNDGLTTDFHKLFLPFLGFQNNAYLRLPDQEILRKEDFLTFSAGAIGSMPISGPLWASAGALASYKRMAMVQFQSVGEDERVRENEVLRMQVEKSTGAEVGLRASLQIDFLNLLRLTLLSYDFSYKYEQSYKIHLSFTNSNLEMIDNDESFKKEFKNGLHTGKVDPRKFGEMVLALEDSKKATLKSKYVLLLLGGMREQDTTHIQITKDDTLHTFFRHSFEKSFFVQNLWSRLFGALFKSLAGLDSIVNNSLIDERRMELEYKNKENLVETKEKLQVEEENFSLQIERSFRSGKLTKITHDHAIEVLETFGGVDPLVWELLRNKQLKGPLEMTGKFVIRKPGLDYLHGLSYKEIYSRIKKVCKSFFCRLYLEKSFDRYWKEWSHKSYSQKLYKSCKPKFKLFQSARKRRFLWESCLQKRTKLSLEEKMSSIPLWRLKQFVQRLSEKTHTKIDLYNFFGVSNVFLHGSFEAIDLNDQEFVSYFREGDFKGLPVVDNFLRGQGLK